MNRPNGLGFSIVLLPVFFLATANLDASPPEPMGIGMVQTIFTDVPPAVINRIVAPTFKKLMKDQTGLDGQMVVGGDAYDLAQQLMQGKLQLGVFHGVDFAWAQQKHKELRPLMIAIYKTRDLKAHLVVGQNSPCSCFADLKGKDLTLACKNKDHCRLFYERHCTECNCTAKSFFGQVVKLPHTEAVLDAVCTGDAACTVIDNVALEMYKELKPGCYKRLKVVKDSEVFPAAVIAYREGGLDQETLNKFRDGMLKANQDETSRDIMAMFKIDSFEPIPDNYGQSLTEIMKAYPPPECKGSSAP